MRNAFLSVVVLISFAGFCYGIPTVGDTLLFEDFESGSPGWTHIDETYAGTIPVYWHASTFMPYGGTGNSWWCGDSIYYNGHLYVGYDNEWLQFLTSPDITLPPSPAGNIILTFKSKYKIEPPTGGYPEGYDGWDGINVRISTDGGETFREITPIGGYPQSSMYGFGYNGEGPGHPGWGGASAGWVTPQFNLNAYAGQTVRIRFAFGSDPGFCTIFRSAEEGNDSTMFGWVVDNITVKDDADTFFFDDAGDTRPASMVGSNGLVAHGDNWTLSTASYHSPTHSFNCAPDTLLLASLISPLIHIPGGDTLTFYSFWYRPDLRDADGDGDNYLEDFFSVWVSSDSGRTWTRLLYDYMRDSSMANNWYLVMGDSIYNEDLTPLAEIPRWSFISTTELTSYAGQEIQLKWLVRCDDNDDGGVGTGLWVDDILVYYIIAKHNDVGVKEIGTTPINLNQNVMFTVILANYGIDNQSDVQSLFRIYDSGGNVVHSGALTPWPAIDAGRSVARTVTWRPTRADNYIFRCWTNLLTDEDRSNDTLEIAFRVYESTVMELGFDDGVRDTICDTTGNCWSYLGASSEIGDGLGVRFTAPSVDSLTLWKVRAYLGSTAPFDIQIFSASASGTPGTAMGEPIYVANPTQTGSYSEYLVNRPIPSGARFFVFLLNSTTNMVTLGMDRTLPHDTTSWAYVTSLGGFLRLASVPTYADVDLMLRIYLYRGLGISVDENGKIIPKFELFGNYPNPFNPRTTISFSIPANSNVRLEIYNMLGQKVRTVLNETKDAGVYAVSFDGRDDQGKALSSGVYFCRLTDGKHTAIKEMLLIK